MRRRGVLAVAAATGAFGLPRTARAAWPADRPIQVLIPGPPGGGMDMLARTFLPFVQHRLPGFGFVVINRPAAGGQQAFEGVAQAAPDGFTIAAAQAPNSVTLPIERQVRYRVQDFTFLGNVIDDPCGLWIRAESPLPARGAAAVEVRLGDGREVRAMVAAPRGSGEDPLSNKEMEAKSRGTAVMGGFAGRCGGQIASARALEAARNVSRLEAAVA